MCFYSYVQIENVMKSFYRKLLDCTTTEVADKAKKVLLAFEKIEPQSIVIGKDCMTGKIIPVADLYDIHKGTVVRDDKEYKHRQESWICLYSEYNWTGLITATQDTYVSLETKEEFSENLRYDFTTDKDIEGVYSVKH